MPGNITLQVLWNKSPFSITIKRSYLTNYINVFMVQAALRLFSILRDSSGIHFYHATQEELFLEQMYSDIKCRSDKGQGTIRELYCQLSLIHMPFSQSSSISLEHVTEIRVRFPHAELFRAWSCREQISFQIKIARHSNGADDAIWPTKRLKQGHYSQYWFKKICRNW